MSSDTNKMSYKEKNKSKKVIQNLKQLLSLTELMFFISSKVFGNTVFLVSGNIRIKLETKTLSAPHTVLGIYHALAPFNNTNINDKLKTLILNY